MTQKTDTVAGHERATREGGGAVVLDGHHLTLEELVSVARDPSVKVECDAAALERVRRNRESIDAIVAEYKRAYDAYKIGGPEPLQHYGVTTGFGEFKKHPVAPPRLLELQENIILSHAVGVGDTTQIDAAHNYFPADVVRASLVLRLNTFLRGNSGVREQLVVAVQRMVNEGVVPLVPTRGSVGSSGDLCPLAHLFLILVNSSSAPYCVVDTPEDIAAGPCPSAAGTSPGYLAELLDPSKTGKTLSYKEGLALTNGAVFSAAVLALAVHDATVTANAADVAAALTLEAVSGCARAFDTCVHDARPFRGQIDSASNVRMLVDGFDGGEKQRSKLVDASVDDIQDCYSIRCAPQVHGAARDTIAYARLVVETELNASTDNPLFFKPDAGSFDRRFEANWHAPKKRDDEVYKRLLRERPSFSAGNFHGEPVALACDFLGVGLAELASISERRTQMLLDENHNRHLPGNLVADAGVNSGFMIAQYCAASLVSENKVLAHPASVDSIPTSANVEDHVSMATIAARKLRTILGNTQGVLAIELMCAAQAVDWRVFIREWKDDESEVHGEKDKRKEDEERRRERKERRDTAFLNALEGAVGSPEEAARSSHVVKVEKSLGHGTLEAYRLVRQEVASLAGDRSLDEDIRRLRCLVESGRLTNGLPLRPIPGLRYDETPTAS